MQIETGIRKEDLKLFNAFGGTKHRKKVIADLRSGKIDKVFI